jgi:hypothetical protein
MQSTIRILVEAPGASAFGCPAVQPGKSRVGYRCYFSDPDGLTIPCTSGVYSRNVQEDRARPGMVLSVSVGIDSLARRSDSR